jgi:hypothetical protein
MPPPTWWSCAWPPTPTRCGSWHAPRSCTTTDQTALLLLLDTDGQERDEVEVPFDAGITTSARTSPCCSSATAGTSPTSTPAVTAAAGQRRDQPRGFTNAIEAALPLELLGGELEAATAATGAFDAEAGDDTGGFADTGLGANLANVAFRTDEPVREWFDERQALALHAGSIDDFLHEVDLDDLRAGRTDTFVPGPGYHERVFASTTEGWRRSADARACSSTTGSTCPPRSSRHAQRVSCCRCSCGCTGAAATPTPPAR